MFSIIFDHVAYSYGNRDVLDDFSFCFTAGKITCLLGPSGSGKTTVLRLIAGFEIPQQGVIKIEEGVVSQPDTIIVPPHKREVGFIFQDLALWPHFTVYENIAFGLNERKMPHNKNIITDMLDVFGISDHLKKYPHQLSGGQKQMVAIARSLVLKPKILLMDEPLANIDIEVKNNIIIHLKQLRHENPFTVLYVTHDHNEAVDIGDEIVVLKLGKVIESGNSEQIRQSGRLFLR